jgi:hypothetical protein
MKHPLEHPFVARSNPPLLPVMKPDASSPYARYQKREYRYSPAYYSWRSSITGKVHRLERQHNANEKTKRE